MTSSGFVYFHCASDNVFFLASQILEKVNVVQQTLDPDRDPAAGELKACV